MAESKRLTDEMALSLKAAEGCSQAHARLLILTHGVLMGDQTRYCNLIPLSGLAWILSLDHSTRERLEPGPQHGLLLQRPSTSVENTPRRPASLLGSPSWMSHPTTTCASQRTLAIFSIAHSISISTVATAHNFMVSVVTGWRLAPRIQISSLGGLILTITHLGRKLGEPISGT